MCLLGKNIDFFDEIDSTQLEILRRIKTLKSKQKKLAIDILKNKRRTALKNIL